LLHLCQYHGNLDLDMSHDTDKEAKLRITPFKHISSGRIGAHDWILPV
jgi:hypothetical protein